MLMRIARLLTALGALTVTLGAQQDPLAWFPLQPGNRWVYEHESKSGDRNHPNVDRWTTEETVTAAVMIPEGIVVLREVKPAGTSNNHIITEREVQRTGDAHPGYLVTRDREPYLVRDNCLYLIGEGWDAQTQALRSSYRTVLAQGTLSPDLCFPLERGRVWGNNDISWRVEPARAGVDSFLAAEYATAIHIYAGHFGSGGQDDVWFQKGVGVVGEHYIHIGTYDEYTKKLVSFSR